MEWLVAYEIGALIAWIALTYDDGKLTIGGAIIGVVLCALIWPAPLAWLIGRRAGEAKFFNRVIWERK